ncbi:MAG: toprim domain-containing protein [Proteobacteria bacterium]|nr:toprim domain-containing protein [Pseudomonadota bacterium]
MKLAQFWTGVSKAGGNILDFVSRMEGIGIREAALRIQGWFGLATSESAPKAPAGEEKQETPKRPERPVKRNKPLGFTLTLDPSHPYLKERVLEDETIETFGLGLCSKGIMAGRIAIPIHDAEGELVAYAGRWPGEPPEGEGKYRLPPKFAKSLVLFNLHRARQVGDGHPLILVEGFFDCLALWQHGYRRTVAVMGSSLSEEQAALGVETVGRDGRVLLFFDEDEAGRKGREDALTRLASQTFVRVVELPEEGLQADQLDQHFLPKIL